MRAVCCTGMLYWLQPYFQWCDNNADVEFIVGVSKVYKQDFSK